MGIKMRHQAVSFLAFLAFVLSTSIITLPAMASNLSEQETNSVNDFDRTEAISEYEVLEAQHVRRLRNQEADLNTLVFENADQTVTRYYFTDAVKYIDSEGKVNDKSSELTALSQSSKYAYASLDNDINTYFPKTLGDGGIVVSTDGYRIEMSLKGGMELQASEDSIQLENSQAEQVRPCLKNQGRCAKSTK